ncbi:histidine kinase dimerization/phosphoacceptor domain -containing protein [Dyadobacter alkalitolerans]|uniref:histidine kinase dimerization/phosphoacceptor domain -containing protein n=1 Tax=Dyadobacter alkalitolerans TaxID=492736 RepID=UPI000420173A|nr:histidine kinase dimerization/phosphoacceptor domain -containing protein [Dyadobacter alkalitolerans]
MLKSKKEYDESRSHFYFDFYKYSYVPEMPKTASISRQKRLRSLLFSLWVLVSIFNVHVLHAQSNSAQDNSEFSVTKRLLSIEDGLASHEVFCGIQDNAGFLWFGTRNGLNRYDGRNSLLFTRQRDKLQENKVVQLAKDNANRLFVQYGSTGFQLMTNGKVDVIDATTREVKTLTAAFPDLPFKERDVYWVANDGTGEVCFLTAFPFRYWLYSAKKGFRLRFKMKDWDKKAPIDYRTTGPFCAFMEGKVLLKLNNQEKQFLITPDTVITFQQHDVLRSLPIGFANNNELLITYNTASNTDQFAVGKLDPNGKLTLVKDPARYNLEPVKNRYWFQVCAATGSGGAAFYIPTDALYLWNKSAFLKVIDHSELKGFENLFIYQLFPDALGNLWLCTSLGVFQLTLKKNRFQPYFSTSQQSIEPNSQARGIYADRNGKVAANIWAHTFSQNGGKMQAVRNQFINYALIKHQSALYSGGYALSRYDDAKNKTVTYTKSLGSEIWSMHSLNDSLLLLGRTNGFSVFNSRTNQFDSIPITKTGAEAKFVYRFFADKTRILWAVAENGLYKLIYAPGDTKKGSYNLSMEKRQSGFLNGLSLLDAYQDPDGIFWLATNGEGLYRWNPKTNHSKQFNITAGFPSDVLYRIEPDAFENLWISSDYGLIRFNRKNFSVNTYTTIDGISHNEFNRTSSFKSSDGWLFFGGLNGVNAFDPREFRTDSSGLEVPLQIIVFNQFIGSQSELVNKTNVLLSERKIVLKPDDKFFTLDFQLLDFTKNESHRYAYKIEGLDTDWNYINENSVRISGLPYGDFALRIRAQNREGAWNKRELNIPITVLKPVYFQWWFILLALTLFTLGVYWTIRLRLKQLAYEKRRLEQIVNERTAQLKQSLSEQSALLSEKDVLMKEIHHRVKNNLQVISGLLELQSKTLTDETAREALQEGRNRVRSIALIHQNLYQFEDLSTIDLKRFIEDLCKQVQSVFQYQKKVNVTINIPEVHLDIDSAVPLGLILNELLTNSFKYAFAKVQPGSIELKISQMGEGKYQLDYMDNGPGLPENLNFNKASTLGLQLINDLSRQIGGRVQYVTDGGAKFTINFTTRDVRKNQD